MAARRDLQFLTETYWNHCLVHSLFLLQKLFIVLTCLSFSGLMVQWAKARWASAWLHSRYGFVFEMVLSSRCLVMLRYGICLVLIRVCKAKHSKERTCKNKEHYHYYLRWWHWLHVWSCCSQPKLQTLEECWFTMCWLPFFPKIVDPRKLVSRPYQVSSRERSLKVECDKGKWKICPKADKRQKVSKSWFPDNTYRKIITSRCINGSKSRDAREENERVEISNKDSRPALASRDF